MDGWLRDTAECDLLTIPCPSDGGWLPPQVFTAHAFNWSLCTRQVKKEQWVSGNKCSIMNTETVPPERIWSQRDLQTVLILSVVKEEGGFMAGKHWGRWRLPLSLAGQMPHTIKCSLSTEPFLTEENQFLAPTEASWYQALTLKGRGTCFGDTLTLRIHLIISASEIASICQVFPVYQNL